VCMNMNMYMERDVLRVQMKMRSVTHGKTVSDLASCECHGLNLAASHGVGVRYTEFIIRSTESLWKDMDYIQ